MQPEVQRNLRVALLFEGALEVFWLYLYHLESIQTLLASCGRADLSSSSGCWPLSSIDLGAVTLYLMLIDKLEQYIDVVNKRYNYSWHNKWYRSTTILCHD